MELFETDQNPDSDTRNLVVPRRVVPCSGVRVPGSGSVTRD